MQILGVNIHFNRMRNVMIFSGEWIKTGVYKKIGIFRN